MGCIAANGRERVLESSTLNNINGATAYPMASVGGAYAGVVVDNYDDHYYGDASKIVDVFDLRTGARSGFGGESSDCHDFAPMSCGIDQFVVGQNGVSAAHVDSGEQRDAIRVSCASAAFCVAYNAFGDVSASTDPPDGPWSSQRAGATSASGDVLPVDSAVRRRRRQRIGVRVGKPDRWLEHVDQDPDPGCAEHLKRVLPVDDPVCRVRERRQPAGVDRSNGRAERVVGRSGGRNCQPVSRLVPDHV